MLGTEIPSDTAGGENQQTRPQHLDSRCDGGNGRDHGLEQSCIAIGIGESDMHIRAPRLSFPTP